jgi:hypothetical protein
MSPAFSGLKTKPSKQASNQNKEGKKEKNSVA